MITEKHLINIFKTTKGLKYGAKFYKVDLHFHTPASEDARGKNRYNFNPYKIKYPPKEMTQDYRHAVKGTGRGTFVPSVLDGEQVGGRSFRAFLTG